MGDKRTPLNKSKACSIIEESCFWYMFANCIFAERFMASSLGFFISGVASCKFNVSFFSIFHIVNNPMDHVLVPKHEIVPVEEHKKIMDDNNMVSKSKFPLIRFHIDPIVRIIGGVPGDIIKITRPSPSSGEYVFYRVVAP